MTWHIIEGAAGCTYAVEHGCLAVIVDALRASATAAMLFDAGATEILAVREVEDAFAAKKAYPDALLFGERGGLPPEGFDYGNSPRTVGAAKGRRVIFTTTTGAGRLIDAADAPAVYMGSTVNASAVATEAARHGRDVVLIPAGLMADPTFDADEDWVAASAIAMIAGAEVRKGAGTFGMWRKRIESEGVERLFETAPHSAKLRRVGLEDDIAYCARVDLTRAVPKAFERDEYGIWVRPVWPTAVEADAGLPR
jgi:2-phosphosulfolactate phosphatase